MKLISVLFTLFFQIVNDDKTLNGTEFCSHFWEIPLRLVLVPSNHLSFNYVITLLVRVHKALGSKCMFI